MGRPVARLTSTVTNVRRRRRQARFITFSSTPNARHGRVWTVKMPCSANSIRATSLTARITVSHDTPKMRATAATAWPS